MQQYSQEVRQALRRSQERERPRESPRGMDAVLGLGEECHGAVGAPPLPEDPLLSWCPAGSSPPDVSPSRDASLAASPALLHTWC